MDVDVVVARWADQCRRGSMSADNLLEALEDLDSQLPTRFADVRPRLTTLKTDVQAAIDSGGQNQAQVQSAAARFLGVEPASVLELRGGPDWYYEA